MATPRRAPQPTQPVQDPRRRIRLATLAEALALQPIPVDDRVSESWARLRLLPRDSNQRMPANDSWIAATALSLGVPVMTQDDHYTDIAGLPVIRV